MTVVQYLIFAVLYSSLVCVRVCVCVSLHLIHAYAANGTDSWGNVSALGFSRKIALCPVILRHPCC